jgi:hypothetical protein
VEGFILGMYLSRFMSIDGLLHLDGVFGLSSVSRPTAVTMVLLPKSSTEGLQFEAGEDRSDAWSRRSRLIISSESLPNFGTLFGSIKGLHRGAVLDAVFGRSASIVSRIIVRNVASSLILPTVDLLVFTGKSSLGQIILEGVLEAAFEPSARSTGSQPSGEVFDTAIVPTGQSSSVPTPKATFE